MEEAMGHQGVSQMSSYVTASINGGAIVRLAEANRYISLAIDSLCGGAIDDGTTFAIKRAMQALGAAEDQISLALLPPEVIPITDRRFVTEGLPAGFNTILGFITDHNPSLLEIMPNPAEDIQADHEVIVAAMIGSGLTAVSVKASPGLLETGRAEDWAYPVEFLSDLYS